MTDNIDAIFFDCFDTILDEHDRSGLCSIPRMSVELGFFQRESEFFDHYIPVCRRPDGRETRLNDRLLLALGKSTGKPKVSVDAAISKMLSTWLTEYPPAIRPAPGVEKMLAHWHGRKKIGMISNFFLPDWPRKLLEREGLDHYFDFIINSAEFGYRKPHRNIYDHALSRIGKTTSQGNSVLFIGDRVDLDIDPPKAMGMNVLHYKNPPRGTEPHHTPTGVESITHWDQFR